MIKRDRLNLELQALERKIRLLLSQYKTLLSTNEALKNENLELKSLIQTKDNQINDFHNKIKISTIVDRITVGEKEVKEVKNKIDEHIKEIDNCINELSK